MTRQDTVLSVVRGTPHTGDVYLDTITGWNYIPFNKPPKSVPG